MKILLLFGLLLSILQAKPFNSNILIEHKIDPDILNSVVSSTRQNVAYKMHIVHTLKKGSISAQEEYFMVVDPYPSYGTELYVEVSKEHAQKLDISEVKSNLDQMMGVQLYIQYGKLYKEDSFEIESQNGKILVVSFTFNKEQLPRELKHFREMKGYIYIENDKLSKVEVRSEKRFELRNIEVDSYKKTTWFEAVKTGGYLVKAEQIKIKGRYDDQAYIENFDGKIVQYWDTQKKEITFSEGVTNKDVELSSSGYTKISIDLDRFFPILGKEARKEGYDLPKPFGVTLVNMFQDTTMHMTSFKLDGSDIDFNKVLDGDSTYKNLTYAPLIRADLWVLPFVSFSAILGVTETNTNVTLASDSGGAIIIPPGWSKTFDPFTTNSLLYGLGATVAGGFDNYFTTIDFQYIVAYTEEADVSIDMMIITPLIGYIFSDYNAKVFVGAQYQRLAQSLTFKLDDTGTVLDGKSGVIGLRSEEWAGVIGTDYSFTRNWSANLLYSQGEDRKNIVMSIAYRF